MTRAMVNNRMEGEPGLLAGSEREKDLTRNTYIAYHTTLREALGIDNDDLKSLQKLEHFLSTAAMYHDIGKTIRRANHPQIGFNILRNFDDEESNRLVNTLLLPGEADDHPSRHNRFSLICSITQHHDKFGVVSTGEGALPIFSDILYFTSDQSTLSGIKKNVTSVMLLNLADIAAVNTADETDRKRSLEIARAVYRIRTPKSEIDETRLLDEPDETQLLDELTNIIRKPDSCLGLSHRKVSAVLSDWKIVIDSICHPTVRGNRGRLKRVLLEVEQNPARTIERVLRLLFESTLTSRADALTAFMDPTRVESVLVGALGSHEFQVFCERFATVVKLDYGLNFFKAIVCACVRLAIADMVPPEEKGDWNRLSDCEVQKLSILDRLQIQDAANHVMALFVKVLNGLVTRYSEVLDVSGTDPRRFGFKLRELTSDRQIREAIIDLLCLKANMDHVALTWIADEVSIWSLD